jgi:hypothetical protein
MKGIQVAACSSPMEEIRKLLKYTDKFSRTSRSISLKIYIYNPTLKGIPSLWLK